MRTTRVSALIGLTLLTCSAQAAVVQFNFVAEFSGGQPPAGPTPWITARFDDAGSAGSVRLTVSTAGLSGSENVSGLYFNLDPYLDSSQLNFTYVSGVNATSVSGRNNNFRADGDGRYDILFSYPSGAGFNRNLTSIYDITGFATLTAQSFYFLSAPAGGHGPFYAAAHVQNTPGGSGWVSAVAAVPLPPAIALLLTGLVSLFGAARAWRRG